MSKTTTTTRENAISSNIPALRKLLKRKDGVSVFEAVDALDICKKSVRILLRELKAKPGDYQGYYVS